MPNHPNRNWRAAMRAQFEQWFSELLQTRPGMREDAREWMQIAYQAGYTDGRKTQNRSRTTTR